MSSKIHVFRLTPGQDLKKELHKYCQEQGSGSAISGRAISAAFIGSAVGSLVIAKLRLASTTESANYSDGPYEIVSLSGTLSLHGLHLHMAISDSKGNCFGGHLLDGCLIHTTAEIVLIEVLDLVFQRELDPRTGYRELVINTSHRPCSS